MNPNEASRKVRLQVGLFVLAGALFAGYMTVYVNDQPYWWKPCQLARVIVDDATGLKKKTPVKSLGLEVGYVRSVNLGENAVEIEICITAPVSIMPETRHYLRSEGFLGDKFLELRPLKRNDGSSDASSLNSSRNLELPWKKVSLHLLARAWDAVVPGAQAEQTSGTEIPSGAKGADINQVMNQMNSLVLEVKGVTTNLKEAIDPNEIKSAVRQLNKTLENASQALSPEGALSATARRALLKLEDAIEQARDQLSRVNQGKGSVGMILNDPEYAEEVKKALKGINKLLGRAGDLRFQVNLGFEQLNAYNGSRGVFGITIWPRPTRFYKIGIGTDPRGNIFQTTTTTEVNGQSVTVNSTRVERGGFALTVMLGERFWRMFDIGLGVLNSDGVARMNVNLGWDDFRENIQVFSDLYFRPQTANGSWTVTPNVRVGALIQPVSMITLTGGLEGIRTVGGKTSYFFGAGVRFDDEDIKLLAAFF